MRVLVIGGSGRVGTLVLPHLKAVHDVRIFDRRPPQDTSVDYVQGEVTSYDDLGQAMADRDAVVYMAMGSEAWATQEGVASAYDVNIRGVHVALWAAHDAGIEQAVYTSSMSVYGGDLMSRYFPDEDISPDALGLYGFTKYLGELVCQNATRSWNMHVNALRLCHPTPEEKWLADTVEGTPTIATTGKDVAMAVLGALECKAGFQAFMISGDYEEKIMNMEKANRMLNWKPLARPTRQPSA